MAKLNYKTISSSFHAANGSNGQPIDIRTIVSKESDILDVLNTEFYNYKGQFIYSKNEGNLYVVNAVNTDGEIKNLKYNDSNKIELIGSSLLQVILTDLSGKIPSKFIPSLSYAEVGHQHTLQDISDYKLFIQVDELPTEDIQENCIYMVKNKEIDIEDQILPTSYFKLYIRIPNSNRWYRIGGQEVSELSGTISNYVTREEFENLETRVGILESNQCWYENKN